MSRRAGRCYGPRPVEPGQRSEGALRRWAAGAWYLTPLLVFAVSRLVVHLVVVMLDIYGYPPSNSLGTWDASWYERIARDGYAPVTGSGVSGPLNHLAFLPGVPFSARWLAAISPLGVLEAGVVISMLTAAVGGVVVWRMAEPLVGTERATAGLALLFLAPSAYVFSMFYTEGPMLLCVALLFWWLHRRQWLLVALAALAAGCIRPNAFLLVVPLAIVLVRDHRAGIRSWTPYLALVAAPAAFVGWIAYAAHRTGEWNGYFHQQDEGWGSRIDGGITTLRTIGRVLAFSAERGNEVTNVLGIALGVIALWCAWKVRLPAEWRWWAVANVVLVVMSAQQISGMRYLLPVFPLFVGAAAATPRAYRPLLVGASGAMMAMFAVMSWTTIKLVP